jgi:hypothetical protein
LLALYYKTAAEANGKLFADKPFSSEIEILFRPDSLKYSWQKDNGKPVRSWLLGERETPRAVPNSDRLSVGRMP